MRELLQKYPNIGYQIIDVDENPDAASRLGVRGVPTIIFEKNGSEAQRVVGFHSMKYFEEIINSL
jgi:thioredoxin 1